MGRALSVKALGKHASKEALAKLRKASEDERRDSFAAMLRAAKLPAPTPEFRFHDERRWRFDFAWPEHRIALEVEGGIWTHGRHTRSAGFLGDMQKYNAAAVLGWRVLRVTPDQLTTRATDEMLRRVL
jgi:hypothetical protein